jgi:hypothetical protein
VSDTSREARAYLDTLPKRDTTALPVVAVEDYTFDQLVTHLHDYHGMTAEDQVDDERSNGTDPEIIAVLETMTRDEAIARLPYHYFQGWGTPDSLASAIQQHADDHANNFGGGGKVHFHPGQAKR